MLSPAVNRSLLLGVVDGSGLVLSRVKDGLRVGISGGQREGGEAGSIDDVAVDAENVARVQGQRAEVDGRSGGVDLARDILHIGHDSVVRSVVELVRALHVDCCWLKL